jgi:hypothetical protein
VQLQVLRSDIMCNTLQMLASVWYIHVLQDQIYGHYSFWDHKLSLQMRINKIKL